MPRRKDYAVFLKALFKHAKSEALGSRRCPNSATATELWHTVGGRSRGMNLEAHPRDGARRPVLEFRCYEAASWGAAPPLARSTAIFIMNASWICSIRGSI